MDSEAFDLFLATKSFFFLGDYQKTLEELSSLLSDVSSSSSDDDEDQEKKIIIYFFKILALLEMMKDEEINSVLKEVKEKKGKRMKIYFNVFLLLVAYLYKGKFDEKKYESFFNELKDIKKYDSMIFPAIYILGLLTLHRENYKDFLVLTDKFSNELEILALKFHLMIILNKKKEMEKIVNVMTIKDPDAIVTQLCGIVFGLYEKNDWENAINKLKSMSGENVKISPKIFNLLGVSLMSKGSFDEALKVLKVGKDLCEKTGDINAEYNCLLVNLITCYRNLGEYGKITGIEETLKKNDENNLYFKREEKFEDMFNEEIKRIS